MNQPLEMNDIFITNLPGGDVRKTLEESIRELARAAGLPTQFVVKVANVEKDLRGMVRTRVGWLRFKDTRVHQQVVELFDGRLFEYDGECRTIRMRVNNRTANEIHSRILDSPTVSEAPKPLPNNNEAESQCQLDLAKKDAELMRKEKALDHTKRALDNAEARIKLLESEVEQSSEELRTARLESSANAQHVQQLEQEIKILQNGEKLCKVCYLPLADRPVVAMRKCRHVFCQQCVNQVAKQQGNNSHIRCPYCNGTPDRWLGIFL